jgi:hypothetical protein
VSLERDSGLAFEQPLATYVRRRVVEPASEDDERFAEWNVFDSHVDP